MAGRKRFTSRPTAVNPLPPLRHASGVANEVVDVLERTIGTDQDRVAPGDGIPQAPIAVDLSPEEINLLGDEFAQEIDLQYAAQETIREDWRNWLALYRAKPEFETKSYPLAHSSNVVVALAAIYTDQVVARIMQSIFQPEPLWLVTELNKRTAGSAKPYEAWLDWNRKNTWDEYKVVKPFVQDVVKLGTGVIYNDWKVTKLRRYDDRAKRTIEVGTRRGPAPTWIPREDFLMPIGFNDIQTAPWVAHRVWCSYDQLERWSVDNVIVNFDKLRGQSDDESELRIERRRNHERMSDGSGDDRFGIWSPWYVWFNRDLDRDGYPESYVMFLHTRERAVLRLQSNPSPSNTRPYNAARFIEVQGEFDGIGIPEQVESLQEEASVIHNQRRDRGHLANIVMYKGNAAGNLPDTIRPESGKVIKVLGDPNKDLVQFNPSGNIAEQEFEEQSVQRLAELRVGLNDPGLGKATSPVGRAAATTMMALMQEGARRFDLNVTDIRYALNDQGYQLAELWQIYGLPAPEETGSPENVLDEKEAMAVRQLLIPEQSNLKGLIAIKLNVSTAAINKEVEKQSNMQLFQLASSWAPMVLQFSMQMMNPMVPMPVKKLIERLVAHQAALLDRIFASHNVYDLDMVEAEQIFKEMYGQAEQMNQVIRQNPQMAMAGMAGQQQGGQPQGPQDGGGDNVRMLRGPAQGPMQ